VQWFEQERLYAAYVSDTARGEDGYAVDLRRFLFGQGIDYPFSEPASPAGETDIAALLDTSDPLVCEVKLYDGDSYRVGRIAGGVQQAVRYARDYGKTVAYLVIFNLCADHLALPSDDPERRPPPCLRVGGVTVYMVVVQALPVGSASKQGRANDVVVTRDQLVTTAESEAATEADDRRD
jgi:hypothetical protein